MVSSSKSLVLASLLTFTCLTLSSTAAAFAFSSVVAAPSFSSPVNISNDANQAHYPWVANVGSNVYVAWTEEDHGIFFRASSNDGGSWSPPLSSPGLRISPHGGVASYPIVYALGNFVYVTWSQSVNKQLQVFFAASSNNGASFSKAIQLTSGVSKNGFITPVIAAAGSNVYIAYTGNGKNSYVVWSNNNGATWHGPNFYAPDHEPQIAAVGNNAYAIADGVVVYVTNNAGASWYTSITSVNNGDEPWIAASGSYVYIVSQTKTTAGKIHFFYSNNVGKVGSWTPSKEPGVVLSGAVTQGDAWEPQITASGNYLYLTFHEL
ncbi:MAG: sialidase family protein, partial [Nitrososphaerales archaeon]